MQDADVTCNVKYYTQMLNLCQFVVCNRKIFIGNYCNIWVNPCTYIRVCIKVTVTHIKLLCMSFCGYFVLVTNM